MSLAVYAALLAALAVGGMQLLTRFPIAASTSGEPQTEWAEAGGVAPTITLELRDFLDLEPRAAVRRHLGGGGRRDTLVWSPQGDGKRLFAIELYRPGSEDGGFGDPFAGFAGAGFAGFVGFAGATGSRPAVEDGGISTPVASKFGPFATVHAAGRAGMAPCIGFVKVFDAPRAHIAGLACEHEAGAAQALIACALDRLDLLSAGGDGRIAGLFARASLKRSSCAPGKPPATAAAALRDAAWIDGAGALALRAERNPS